MQQSKRTCFSFVYKTSHLAVALALLAGQQALATAVPVNTNLSTLTPVSGDTWDLQGNEYDSGTVTLPATLTINGATGGSVITMNDGAATPQHGLFSGGTSVITIGNGLTFTGGNRQASGGVFNVTGGLTLDATGSSITFSNNSVGLSPGANVHGGAIFATGAVTLNGQVNLINNHAGGYGGAINAGGAVTINGDLYADNNSAGYDPATGTWYSQAAMGGVINATNITVTGKTTLTNNSVVQGGGALYASGDLVLQGDMVGNNNASLNRNGGAVRGANSVTFGGNVSMDGNLGAINGSGGGGGGGAIYAGAAGLNFTAADGMVLLTNNQAGASGGAILSYGATTFAGGANLSNNAVVNSGSGGAIYSTGDVQFTNAGKTVTVSDNTAKANGGAFRGLASLTMAGSATFTGNKAEAGAGGAIYMTKDVTLNASAGDTLLSNNSAGLKGGAIWAGGNVTLNANGGDITFTGNRQDGTVGNAIWLENADSTATATFNAEAGRSVTFFDPIQNNLDKGLVNVVKSGAGLVSFDGAQYSADADRWSQVYAKTDVQGGTFEVANNAVYGMQTGDVTEPVAGGTPLAGLSSSFNMGDNTTLQGGVMGTIRADAVSFGNNVTVAIAGRQQDKFGVLQIASPSLSLGESSRILFNTYLNDGVEQKTDLLQLNGSVTSGHALVDVKNAGGPGGLTQGNGIKLVQVDNGGSTASDTFKLGGRVVAGAYEYDLYQGGVGEDATDGNWYLRSIGMDNGYGGSGSANPTRVETGVYLRNKSAASSMFMHTLHDRLGEPQYTDAYQAQTNGKVTSLWMRVVGNHTDGNAANGQIDLSTDTGLVHLGGDLARWSSNGNDRWQFGLMGAYGQSDTDASVAHNPITPSGYKRTANGKVDGYGVGGYLTWYGNKDKPTGPYVDLWTMYGWYNNKVQGNMLAQEKYDSTNWTTSIEGGYAFIAHDGEKRQWMIEPQAQVAYNSYSADNHLEQNGTWVTDGNQNGVVTRLGARVYSRSKLGDNGIQPFVEANWWHGTAQNSMRFGDDLVSDGTPKDTFELKAGLQGQIAKNWQLWGHVGGRWGSNNYSSYEGMVGVKYQF